MSGRIYLDEEHGVNPAIVKCAWCGEDKNELALMGTSKIVDPRTGQKMRYNPSRHGRSLVDGTLQPCDKCAKIHEQGILMFALNEHGIPRKWIVVSEEWVKRSVKPNELRDSILKHRMAQTEDEVIDNLIAQQKALEEAHANNDTPEAGATAPCENCGCEASPCAGSAEAEDVDAPDTTGAGG